MAINKVVYGASVLVDLTADTVSPDTLLSGTTAHSASGDAITGSFVPISITPFGDIETGELTPDADMTSMPIEASKGEPVFISFVCVDRNGINPAKNAVTAFVWTVDALNTTIRALRYYKNASSVAVSTAYGNYSGGTVSFNKSLKAGWTYHYCIMYK